MARAGVLLLFPVLMINPGMSLAQPAPQAMSASMSIADFGADAAIEIDGELDARWADAPPFDDFSEYRPRQGVPASVRTEVRFARDRTHLYVVARMFDPDISRLRTGLARRDSFSNEQDWISIAIDPVGTRRVSQLFYFNASGVVWDGLTNEDSGSANSSADFEVDVATRIGTDSWTVELRIPFEELRYVTRTPDSWHVLVRRNYPREVRHAMAAPAIPANAPCFMCLAAPLHPPGELPSPSGFSAVPQVVALRNDTDTELEPSLDAKWRVGPSTVFDAALNPDFSQVELDTPQLSSNRQFAVILPEKRPFFLEGIDILESPLTAIYTRSITDPVWGLRGTHRGSWDGVLLNTIDEGGGVRILPGAYRATYLPQDSDSHATIGRVRKPVGAWTLGALLTDRRSGDAYNTVAGPDISWRLSAGTRINAQWLSSRTRGDAEFPGLAGENGDGNAASLDFLHEGKRWRTALTYSHLDEEFRADNGYLPQVGIRQLTGEVRYRMTDLKAFAELAPYVTTDTRDDLDGARVSHSPRAGVQTTLPNNLVLITEIRPREELRLLPGSTLHDYQQGYLALTSYPGGQFPLLTLSAIVGEAVDFSTDRVGHGETWSASLLWRPIHRLEIQPGVDFTRVRTSAAGTLPAQDTRESAAQLLATLHLTVRDRFRLIAQRVNVQQKVAGASLVGDTRWVGSLLFTHERSLTRRIYAGISYERTSALFIEQRPETVEVFLKLQWGMSTGRGIKW